MIELILALQLQGYISTDIDQQIQDKYPCQAYDLLMVAHSKYPDRAWRRLEREYIWKFSRRQIKEMKQLVVGE